MSKAFGDDHNQEAMGAVVQLRDAELVLGRRQLWQSLNLDVAAGEFVAVLGPNGSGKTSLLRVLLGLYRLSAGTVTVLGATPHRGSNAVGYVPQQRAFDPQLPLRGRDLVGLGLDGHRYGVPLHRQRQVIDQTLRMVGAEAYGEAPIGRLSGGEQQRLRIAQAVVSDPRLLLCDEPLLSLDPAQQEIICELIDRRRREAGTTVLFVTHEINPILPLVDRMIYFVNGRWAVGSADEILTSQRLSELYGRPIEVVRVKGRIVVVGTGEATPTEVGGHHHHNHGRLWQ